MPIQANVCRRRVEVITMSVPIAATYQVAEFSSIGLVGSSWLVTSRGSAMQTATLKVAIQLGICNARGPQADGRGDRVQHHGDDERAGVPGPSIATMASTRWYAENVAASATMRSRGTEMFTRSPLRCRPERS